MSGFLDRLAARAVGEARSLRPRVRARFEPVAGALPGEPPARPGAEEEEGAAAVPASAEAPSPAVEERTFEPAPPLGSDRPAEPSSPPPPVQPRSPRVAGEAPRPAQVEAPPSGEAVDRRAARERVVFGEPAATISNGEVAPPLPAVGRAAERGGRGVRAPGTEPAERPLRTRPLVEIHRTYEPSPLPPAPPERRRRAALTEPAEPVEPAEPAEEPRDLAPRPRSSRADDLPTVEPARAPLSPALLVPDLEDEGPSETVIRVSIGRIDVRTPPPPAAAPRPARSAGPRLSLAEYLERRQGRRR